MIQTNYLFLISEKSINQSITSALINELYMEASLGKIDSSTFWNKLGFIENHRQIESNYLDGRLTLDEEFHTVANELKETYNLALLSNDVSEWSSYPCDDSWHESY